jgi:hypothetical protein
MEPFETELREQGYAGIVDPRMEANTPSPKHVHEFDARLLMLDGPSLSPPREPSVPTAAVTLYDKRGLPPVPSATDPPWGDGTWPGGVIRR